MIKPYKPPPFTVRRITKHDRDDPETGWYWSAGPVFGIQKIIGPFTTEELARQDALAKQ